MDRLLLANRGFHEMAKISAAKKIFFIFRPFHNFAKHAISPFRD